LKVSSHYFLANTMPDNALKANKVPFKVIPGNRLASNIQAA
jgi:hypothetical protein